MDRPAPTPRSITLFLAGDVMTGRGIDQILPHPSKPRIPERQVRSAIDYVKLAERATGPIERPVDFGYVWGDALIELDHVQPDVRIINLETSITVSEDSWPGKGIGYRMHPQNIGCLTAARSTAAFSPTITCSTGAARVCWRPWTCFTEQAFAPPVQAGTSTRRPGRPSWKSSARAACSSSPSALRRAGYPASGRPAKTARA